MEAFENPEKHEPEKLALLRLKLAAKGIDVDVLKAVRDYRDLKIEWEEFKERTHSQIEFDGHVVTKHVIPGDLIPALTEDAFRRAMGEFNKSSDMEKKLQWLYVVYVLLHTP